MGRSICLSCLLTAGLITQLGCAQADLQPGDLAFCDTSAANGLPEPHLVINPAERTISAHHVTYQLEDCSNAEFICLDGQMPFIQPRPSTRAGNSRIELRGNAEVRIAASGNRGFRIEISRIAAPGIQKITYNYGVDSSLQSLEIINSVNGTAATARYEPCRQPR